MSLAKRKRAYMKYCRDVDKFEKQRDSTILCKPLQYYIPRFDSISWPDDCDNFIEDIAEESDGLTSFQPHNHMCAMHVKTIRTTAQRSRKALPLLEFMLYKIISKPKNRRKG